MHICERCGSALPDTASFCGLCGSASPILQNGSADSGKMSSAIYMILPEDAADSGQSAQPLDEQTPPRSEELADEPAPPLDAALPAEEAENDWAPDANEETQLEHDDNATLAASEHQQPQASEPRQVLADSIGIAVPPLGAATDDAPTFITGDDAETSLDSTYATEFTSGDDLDSNFATEAQVVDEDGPDSDFATEVQAVDGDDPPYSENGDVWRVTTSEMPLLHPDDPTYISDSTWQVTTSEMPLLRLEEPGISGSGESWHVEVSEAPLKADPQLLLAEEERRTLADSIGVATLLAEWPPVDESTTDNPWDEYEDGNEPDWPAWIPPFFKTGIERVVTYATTRSNSRGSTRIALIVMATIIVLATVGTFLYLANTRRLAGREIPVVKTPTVSPASLLTIQPDKLDFGLVAKGSQATLVLTLTNKGNQPLHWTIDTGAPWLTVQSQSGVVQPSAQQPGSITIVCDTTTLDVNNYTATVHIHTDVGDRSIAAQVQVINPNVTKLYVSPNSLDFGTMDIGQVASQDIKIGASGKDDLLWQIDTGGANWIAPSSSAGSLQPGTGEQAITITLNTSILTAGDHSATLKVHSNGGDAQVSITVHILQPAAKLCNIQGVDLGKIEQGMPAEGDIALSNCGNLPLTWTASSSQSWVTTSGTGPIAPQAAGTIHVVVNTNALPAGATSTANITITPNMGTPQQTTVTITLFKPATLCKVKGVNLGKVDPGTIAQGDIPLANCGELPLTWTATSDQPWLTVTASGQNDPGTAGTIHVVADTTTLLPGSVSTANVTITPNVGKPQQAKVTVTIKAPPTLCNVTPSITLPTVQQGQPSKGAIKIGNCGDSTLTWTAIADQSWLAITSGGTVAARGTGRMPVSVDTTVLAPGTYTANVTITADAGQQAVATVTITVNAPLQCSIQPAVDFGQVAANTTAQGSIPIACNQQVNWRAKSNSAWLKVTGSGSLATDGTGSVAMTANTKGLAPGVYTATVTVTPVGGTAVAVTVTITVV